MAVTELTIRYLGPKGDGIHQGNRGPVYVERAIPGDRVLARVQKDQDGIQRGEIVEIVEPSPYRQQAPCEHYETCGGCTLQHVDEENYRAWKIELVAEALRKQGLRPRQWLTPVFLGGANRRRATFAALKLRGKIIMGYYRRRSRQVSDVDACLIADPRLLALRETLKRTLGTILTEGKIADIFVQLVDDAVDVVVTGPVGRSGKPDMPVREAMAGLVKDGAVTRIGWRAGERDRIEPMAGKGQVTATFGALKVSLPPDAFLQPTEAGERALVDAVMAAVPASGRFADLFSGCGTFSGPLLSRGSVDAYESVAPAVSALAKAAGQKPLKAFRRDLFRNPLRREELNRYDAVVFDPPRGGCPEQAEAMASAKTGLLVGVSCNPATFARDARILCDGGYWLQSVRVIDQFLWSHHVEVVGVFTKQKRRFSSA